MKKPIQNYMFDPLLKQITLTDCSNVKLEHLLLIINKTANNTMIYNFADSTLTATVLDNVITLNYDTTLMSSTDALQIYIEAPTESVNAGEQYLDTNFTYDVNLDKVFGTQPLTEDQRLKVNTSSKDKRVQGSLSTLNQYFEVDCNGMSTCAIQLNGNWAGTIFVEGNVDGSSQFYSLLSNNSVGGLPLNYLLGAIQANGIYRISISALNRLRVRLSSVTSGIATVTIVTSINQYAVPLNLTSSGQLHTYDTVLANLVRKGQTDQPLEQIFTPNVNPSMPTSYADNKFSKMAQIYQRLRVEIGGSERLPFTQETNTNNLVVTNNDERRLLEEILIQITLLNQNFALVNNVNMLKTEEIK